jgi:hypothetical protein
VEGQKVSNRSARKQKLFEWGYVASVYRLICLGYNIFAGVFFLLLRHCHCLDKDDADASEPACLHLQSKERTGSIIILILVDDAVCGRCDCAWMFSTGRKTREINVFPSILYTPRSEYAYKILN